MVTVNCPATVGVPPSNPSASPAPASVARLIPAGRGLEFAANDQWYGGVPPLAATLALYICPTVPFCSVGDVVIARGPLCPQDESDNAASNDKISLPTAGALLPPA